MSTSTMLAEPTTAVKPSDVTLTDGCDRCGYSENGKGARISEPFVQVTLKSGSKLLFCKHHANKHVPALAMTGAEIKDWSEKINLKASQSSV